MFLFSSNIILSKINIQHFFSTLLGASCSQVAHRRLKNIKGIKRGSSHNHFNTKDSTGEIDINNT